MSTENITELSIVKQICILVKNADAKSQLLKSLLIESLFVVVYKTKSIQSFFLI